MKRTDLYELVWSKPMTHLAREFGLSDVGLRKICVRHNIPTPPLGYWAKVAHGKSVKPTPLPPSDGNTAENVRIVVRPHKITPPEIQAARQAATELEEKSKSPLQVPSERPEDLHSVAEKVEKSLQRKKPDYEGFLHCNRKGLPNVSIGPDSVERAVIFMDTFIKAVISRGHSVKGKDDGLCLLVDNESFEIRLYETKDRKPHEPTAKELKAQKERDEWRNRYPNSYESDWKLYRTWDYCPSGRLSLQITDPTATDWSSKNLIGRWHDRRTKKLEDYLPRIMATLASAPVSVRHRREEEAEQERIRAEEHARWCREMTRKERARNRRSFIEEKANEFAKFQQIAALSGFISKEANTHSAEPVGRISRVIEQMVSEMRLGFERKTLNEEISKLELFDDDDPV